MQFQQDIMQKEVKMQLKGVEVQMKGQKEAMMRFLKEIKKRRRKRRKQGKGRQSLKQDVVRLTWTAVVAAAVVFNVVIVITTYH
jgi:hypothetical protein